MRTVRIAVILIGAVVGLLIIGGLLLPGEIRVARSIEIDVPPAQVFPFVNDPEAFNHWSPWAAVDNETRYEFAGPESGVGARLSWSSDNPEVGSGTQEIIRSRPPEQVVMQLDFGPQGSAEASFDLEPVGTSTRVTWSFGYEIGYDLIGRYVGLLMERLVGEKYEEGLERLKRLAETGQV
ncbi:MAG: SRPBCC family protein [Chromatiaceae bacterium]|nr:SRPBCC family protein [Chromatiaceae bacterium]